MKIRHPRKAHGRRLRYGRGLGGSWFILPIPIFRAAGRPRPAPLAAPARVKPGIEVLIEKRLDLIRGKKVGLITNPSGVDAGLRSSIDLLREAEGFELMALYGPEHGARGNAQAGEYVPFYKDEARACPSSASTARP